MNKKEAIKEIEQLINKGIVLKTTTVNIPRKSVEAFETAIKSLKLTSVKECETCLDKGCCAIYDNFNIDFCSDYRGDKND